MEKKEVRSVLPPQVGKSVRGIHQRRKHPILKH